jgi:hypothetical protein
MTEIRASRALTSFTLLATTATLVLLTLGWLDLRRRLAEQDARAAEVSQALQRVERAVQLFRFERGSKGLGVAALLEQLRFWAPMLEVSSTPQKELPVIQQRVDDILTALSALGPEAFDPLHKELTRCDPGKDDELIRWLLQGMTLVDPARGKDVLATAVRGFEFPVTSRIRSFAAERLLELDRERAARLLSEVLTYETAAGIDSGRMPQDLQAKFTAAKVQPAPMRMLFNFVDTLVRAAPGDLEERLIMVATRPEQDRMTVQTCVRHLGEMKSQRALRAIKKLYDTPPEMAMNPIFQNHCLDAIGRIEGAGACDYFKDMLRKKPDERVQAKLQDLIKQHCP